MIMSSFSAVQSLRYRCLLIIAGFVVFSPMLSIREIVTAQNELTIKVLESSNTFPNPEAIVEVSGPRGQALADLQTDQFTILQNGQPVAPDQITVTEQEADAAGPVLALVLDASTVLGAEEVESARRAAIGVLQAGSQLSPENPEMVTLFVPSDSPDQPSQVSAFADFTYDHNAVINYLNTQLELKTGTTRLYETLLDAINAVADQSAERGTPGYVVVLSDGKDNLSLEAYEQALSAARERQVPIMSMSFGPRPTTQGIERLQTLAEETSGAYLDRPTPEQAEQRYTELAQVTPRITYRVSYTSDLPVDDDTHGWQILVVVDGVEARSQQILFQATLPAQTLRPLGGVLRTYLIWAIPAAVVISALLTLMLSIWQRFNHEDSRKLRGGLQNAATVKRTGGRS